MKMQYLLFAALLATPVWSQKPIVEQVSHEYSRKQADYNAMAKANRYKWEIVDVIDFPYWCVEGVGCSRSGDKLWIPGYGQVLLKTDEGVYIGVRSWIDRDSPEDKAQVTRLFLYKQNSNGLWYRARTMKVTQVWEESAGWVCQR
jgi:hypothetical protein